VRRHGLVPKSRARRHIGPPGKPTTRIAAPNAVGTTDFPGQLKTGDGLYGSPLTVADGCRRFRLGCPARSSTRVQAAKPGFVRLCKACGLPTRLRPANGVPCATTTLAQLAQLAAWWVRLGLLPAGIAPGQPPHNGRHERRHRPLNAATTRPPATTRRAPQPKVDRCRQGFHCERPPVARDRQPPASRGASAPRQVPDQRPPLEYPDRFEVRYVRANGGCGGIARR
jgi:hypothetical protein